MSKHTPGPWTIWEQTDPDVSGPSAHVAIVNDIYIIGSGQLATPDADAHLIAAAPDLLSALRFILAFYEPGQTHLDTNAWKVAMASARAAIAKAEGKTHDR